MAVDGARAHARSESERARHLRLAGGGILIVVPLTSSP